MSDSVTTFTVNAVGKDGRTYPLYFDCADIIDAENIVRQTGLLLDEAGVCELVSTLKCLGN